MKDIIFLEPVFKEMIWGGNRLNTDFGYEIPSNHTGECWAISAHKNGDCVVKNGEYKGITLSSLWDNHRELFGGLDGETFPLLIKIIDAKEDLSIQVHPNDVYAEKYENGSLGKTECWYILDCKEDAKIVIGHNAKNKEDLKGMIAEHKWDELIRVLPIQKGDFFQINPGTVHAIKEGTLLLETQQNSNITYRLYDYDRLSDGKPRELHIDKSIDVIQCPHVVTKTNRNVITLDNGRMEELVTCPFYSVSKIVITGKQVFSQTEPFTIISVIEGSGVIDEINIQKGDHFILPAGYGNYSVEGNLTLITSRI